MTEDEFRRKYPHSTEEQVRLYCEAVKADGEREKPADILMERITVPVRPAASCLATSNVTTYASGGVSWFGHLADVPPEVAPSHDGAEEMRGILLGRHGFNAGLSPEMKERLQTTDMTEEEMLAMLVGAPSAREFADLA